MVDNKKEDSGSECKEGKVVKEKKEENKEIIGNNGELGSDGEDNDNFC